ncbi:Sortilin, neurotensin receptor 3 [Flavobacteriaceae bacterium MAR_2010_188]|nr:Sortilin, neurotensin receptor 3 [Flavobacteriaceae bacterium MAR_2010_188]
MKLNSTILLTFLAFFICIESSNSQKLTSDTFSGLEFREIGTALTSGRIADIAIQPDNEKIMYAAAGSGGVWKTENAGTTWTPIFDKESTYSIGCITIDPNDHNTIWVGTGENVGGRHVAFGDGIFVSHDAGKSWKNVGLKDSEHISKVIVSPEDSNIIWVASQGPLWSKGGDRGVFKSIDGGATWKRTLGDTEWVGATDILIDPDNTDVLYAATWQRQRTVAALLGSGPGSGIHKSNDGGETWTELTNGLPSSNMGKIGLAMSHFDSNVIYAAIELDRGKGGVYMSDDAGASWNKQSDTVSGGTGPHYYQELYASPHHDGRLYLMNNNVLISNDDGKSFYSMNEENKHVDTHAVAFRESDPDYLIMGTDGGLFETFDHTKTWRYISNLPLSQYYKLAVDDAKPFYNIYGGTQDNGSHGAPSQTTFEDGIRNSDFWVTLGADGYAAATEPGNPNIVYGEFQEGTLWRIDQATGETVFIQPQARAGEPFERFNWDAPILVSPHKPTRLYFASQRVWKSEDRGDSWTPISEDITLNQDRLTLPMYGKQQSWDNAWDVGAMSNYNTITSLSESPVQEELIYAGTDDGSVSVTEDGGKSWRKFSWSSIKGMPNSAFVNDVRADLFDANVAYAAVDNHKNGDYKPYILKTSDKGKTWSSIAGDLPQRLLIWRVVQDHVKKDLLFAAAENGIYVTKNGGKNWVQLKGGLPTIAFRDLTIQKDENDLVGASFGRGFYILDDISPIRDFDENATTKELTLYDTPDALWYKQKDGLYGQGDNEYKGKNPPFGAVFTYYMPEKYKSMKDVRSEKEKEGDMTFPGWDALQKENREDGPNLLLLLKDAKGNIINTVSGTNKKGFNRVNWNLTIADKTGERLDAPSRGVGRSWGGGIMATPGEYTVTVMKRLNGEDTVLAGPQTFNVKPLYEGSLPRKSYEEMNEFLDSYNDYRQDLRATSDVLEHNLKLIDAMKRAADKVYVPADVYSKIASTKSKLQDLDTKLNGNKIKEEIGERSNISASDGSGLGWTAFGNTYGPTAENKLLLDRVENQLSSIKSELRQIVANDITAVSAALKKANAPYIEGQGLIDED